jgi:predicted acyltransferase
MEMSQPHIERLQSLDIFRGFTMVLLLAEGTNLYYFLNVAVPENSIFHKLTLQLYHSNWNGLRFWDLIQPYFTFIVGVAMTFSLTKRAEKDEKWGETFKYIAFRCSILFLLGIVLQSGYREKLVWELWNILTQLSVSIFITFLIFRFRNLTQIIISLTLLLITELLYRNFSVEGFNRPFVKGSNFGTFMDLILMGKTHPDGWVVFNCIPATAHMIWGALTGKVLININSPTQKIKILGLTCITCLIIGYGMDWLGISPINKKICTSSFVIASGGWTLASFLFLYWIVDINGYKRWGNFIAIVGLNPIFIYVFSRTVGRGFLNDFIPIFTKGFMSWFVYSEGIINFATYISILGIEWYLCYWLYKRKIIIKI